jgi:hypothetical protein
MIKAYRKPAAGGQQDAEDDETLYEIKVTMKDNGAFTTISDYLTIVDLPGIEDGIKSFFIKNFVDENLPRLIPAILVNLTQGAFSELQQFEDFEALFSDEFKPVPIIFTKFYNMQNDIANKLKEQGITKQSNPDEFEKRRIERSE